MQIRLSGVSLLVSLALPTTTAAQEIRTDNGQPFTTIDPNWTKPTRRSSTIQVKNGRQSCGPAGRGGDSETNRHKNRTDVPPFSYLVTVDAIRSLNDTALWGRERERWSASDRVFVFPYEGTPVTVIGYFEIVKPQQRNPPPPGRTVGETTNCNAWAERDTDWHIALVADPSEREEQSIVIEPTPRFKRRNSGWVPATARQISVRRQTNSPRDETVPRVRVTGYLMLDPQHPGHIRGACRGTCQPPACCYRATLWEIHPVSRIEVWRNNAWVDLNDY